MKWVFLFLVPEIADEDAIRTFRKADTLVYESGIIIPHESEFGSKQYQQKQYQNFQQPVPQYNLHNQRDSLPTDLRAIRKERPQPKKPASKNIGALPPPPPQRENSFNQNDETVGNNNNISTNGNNSVIITTNNNSIILMTKKEAPPLPPPRLVKKKIFPNNFDKSLE